MIQIDNKFCVGEEVYYIGRKPVPIGKKQKYRWIVKTPNPVIINSVIYIEKLRGESELKYNIGSYGNVKEAHLFPDYKSAKEQCDKWNEEGYML